MPIRSSDLFWLDLEVVRDVAVVPSAPSTACQAACSAIWRPRTCAWTVPGSVGTGAAPAGGVDAPWPSPSQRCGIGIRSFSRSSCSVRVGRRDQEWRVGGRLSANRGRRCRRGTRSGQRQRGLGRLGALDVAGRGWRGGTDLSGPGSAWGTSLRAVGLLRRSPTSRGPRMCQNRGQSRQAGQRSEAARDRRDLFLVVQLDAGRSPSRALGPGMCGGGRLDRTGLLWSGCRPLAGCSGVVGRQLLARAAAIRDRESTRLAYALPNCVPSASWS